MTSQFEEDFARWEEGDISFEELAAKHPDAPDLKLLRDQLTSLVVPTPSPDSGWEAIRERLPDSSRRFQSGVGRRVRRSAVAAAATVLLTAGVVLAVEPVGEGATWFLNQVAGFIGQGVAAIIDLPTSPTARDVSLTGAEDVARSWVPAVNDQDGEALRCFIASSAAHGEAEVRSDCSAGSYIPDPDVYGPDVFTYSVTDEQGLSATAAVAITLLGVNDPPEAVNDRAATEEDTSVTIELLANDDDVDGAPPAAWSPPEGSRVDKESLTVGSVFGADGSVTTADEGLLTYTPEPNFNGIDSFQYTVWDGSSGFDSAKVSVVVSPVNDVPVASDVSLGIAEDLTLDWVPSVSDVDEDNLTCSILSSAAHGKTEVDSECSGGFYAPDPDFSGADSFTYVVSDGTETSGPATVTLTVRSVNDVPAGGDLSLGVDEDQVIDWVPIVRDVEDDELSCSILTSATHGRAETQPRCSGGSYTPDPDFNGIDTFTYQVSDGTDKSTPATVTITVHAVNDVPVAGDDVATADENTPIIIQVLANDGDADGDALFIESVTSGAHGAVSNNGDGTLTFMPDVDFVGADSFTYTVSDGHGGTSGAAVLVLVTPGVSAVPPAVSASP